MKPDFKPTKVSQIEISQLMLPSHSNFSGKIHGGHILSMMDQVAFACASKHSGEYCVTASVDRVEFRTPIEVGELVTMKAQVNYVGRTSMVVGIRVEAENIQTGEVKHSNSSYFTMVAKDASGKTVPVPGLIVADKHDVRRFLRSARRMESIKHRRMEFGKDTHEEFIVENYLEELKKFRLKLEL
ncbi:acyl-CoA thioesterase [Fulvitalea axinellae]|uniref:Acyl-CoA thioesterase n=1 Tax=Fulvitalea axinellae TaxID=1182444 RepID=A0AAU9D0X9_9BACT|nr:acyl-CoA thioesterase [Fulvitalea axinellae]